MGYRLRLDVGLDVGSILLLECGKGVGAIASLYRVYQACCSVTLPNVCHKLCYYGSVLIVFIVLKPFILANNIICIFRHKDQTMDRGRALV